MSKKKLQQGIADDHGFVRIRERDVERQVEREVFDHGTHLFRQGAIVDPVLVGDTIRAICEDGSLYQNEVQATLTRPGDRGHNPSSFDCTCSDEDMCAHVVALLLSWIDDPDRFMQVQTTEALLDGKSREELVEVVERMLSAQPDRIRLLDASTIEIPGTTSSLNVTPEAVVFRIFNALQPFRMYRPIRGAITPGTLDLQEIVAVAFRLGQEEKWSTVKSIFHSLSVQIIDVLEDYSGDDGALEMILAASDNGLSEALLVQDSVAPRHQLSSQERHELIHGLYGNWRFGAMSGQSSDMGYFGLGTAIPAMTAKERETVEGWLDTDSEVEERGSDAIIALRAQLLEANPGRDEDILELFKQAGWWEEYTSLLLENDRVEEAVAIAEQHLMTQSFTLSVLDEVAPWDTRDGESIQPLIQGFPWTGSPQSKIREATIDYWLLSKYLGLGKSEQALDMAKRYFRRRPSLVRWEDLRAIAHQPGMPPNTWENMRQELEDAIRESGRTTELIEIKMQEGEIRAALDLHANFNRDSIPYQRGWHYGVVTDRNHFLQQERDLAFLAGHEYPDEAIEIYVTQAEEFISERTRDYYRDAAAVLTHARSVADAHGRQNEWETRMAELRARYPRLRALQEELTALEL